MIDLKHINEALTSYVRPQTFPVAIRMCESAQELPEKVRFPAKDMGITISLCHGIAMARRQGWTVAIDKSLSCYGAGISMGFLPLLSDIVDGSYQESIGLWGMSKEQAAAIIKNLPKFEYGKYTHVLMAPLHRTDFEPHLILIYGNPAQLWVLVSGYLLGSGKAMLDTTLLLGAGCTTYITRAMQTDEPQFDLIDMGERLIPHPQDHECVFSVPVSKIETLLQGMELGRSTSFFKYPIPSFIKYNSQHAPGYDKMRKHLLGED